MVVRFNRSSPNPSTDLIGVEGDPYTTTQTGTGSKPKKLVSEAEKIVNEAKKKVEAEGGVGVGVSGSNSGKGHDPVFKKDDEVAVAAANPVPIKESSTVKGEEAAVLEKEKEELGRVVEEDSSVANRGEDSKEVDVKAAEDLVPAAASVPAATAGGEKK